VSEEGVAVTVTTAVPLHAAAAISANASGSTNSFDHPPRVLSGAFNDCIRLLLCDSSGLRSTKQAKICEVSVMRCIASRRNDTGDRGHHPFAQAMCVGQFHSIGLAGAGSAGTSGTVERRNCFASWRAFLAASLSFFA
jgi:hypothetical protein